MWKSLTNETWEALSGPESPSWDLFCPGSVTPAPLGLQLGSVCSIWEQLSWWQNGRVPLQWLQPGCCHTWAQCGHPMVKLCIVFREMAPFAGSAFSSSSPLCNSGQYLLLRSPVALSPSDTETPRNGLASPVPVPVLVSARLVLSPVKQTASITLLGGRKNSGQLSGMTD